MRRIGRDRGGKPMDDWWFQDAQGKLTKRFTEFIDLHRSLVKKAKRYHHYGTSVHLTIIILGAVSAAQATVKNQVGADSRSIILFFSILAILMTIGAGLESFFKWNHKSGAFYSLAAMCTASLYKMHDQWQKVASEYAAKPNQVTLGKVLKLADDDLEAMNSKIVHIHNRAAALGVTDLKLGSLGPKDMFNVALDHTRIDLSSDGNGRPAEGKASLNAHDDARASMGRLRVRVPSPVPATQVRGTTHP
jgi:hypothetical protein